MNEELLVANVNLNISFRHQCYDDGAKATSVYKLHLLHLLTLPLFALAGQLQSQ